MYVTPVRSKLTHVPCKECGSKHETPSRGYIVCTTCGMVKERSYTDHLPIKIDDDARMQSQNSVGKNLQYIGTLGSEIGYKGKAQRGGRGVKLEPRTIYKFRRLSRFYQQRYRIEGNATHLRTLVIFNRICNHLKIHNSLKQRALYIYWEQVQRDVNITNHVLLSALCLLLAVREARDRAPIRFSEVIAAYAENNHRVTNKNILRLARELELNLAPVRRIAEDYIERIASAVVWHPPIQQRIGIKPLVSSEYEILLVKIAYHFLGLLDRHDRGGVQPFPFAVSIIYLADRALAKFLQRRQLLTQKLLAEAADSAEYTIRDHVYRFLGDLYRAHENELLEYTGSIYRID